VAPRGQRITLPLDDHSHRQGAQDGAVSSTVKTLESARSKAGKEADGVQAEGAKAVEGIQSSAGERRDAAVQLVIDSLMSN